jgi:hypothetical protein
MSLRTRSEAILSATKNYPVATTAIVAAVAGQRSGIYRMVLQAVGASVWTIQDTGGGVLSATYTMTTGSFVILDVPINNDPWWQSPTGLGLQMVVTGAAIVADIWTLTAVA